MWREQKSKEENEKYKSLIDEMVQMLKSGQGKIPSQKVKSGVWNENATKDFLEDQHEINQLLEKLSVTDREIIAKLLDDAVETGVFECLKILEDKNINPFEEGFEGSPYEDFIGRIKSDWEWPSK